jgi:hypothetical protein
VLPAVFIAASAAAATNDNAGLVSAPVALPAAAPCLRAHCVDPAVLVERSPAMSAPRVLVKAGGEPASERGASARMAGREQAEDYNCLLSVGFGGELRAHGQRDFKALGQTWTGKAGDKAAR